MTLGHRHGDSFFLSHRPREKVEIINSRRASHEKFARLPIINVALLTSRLGRHVLQRFPSTTHTYRSSTGRFSFLSFSFPLEN